MPSAFPIDSTRAAIDDCWNRIGVAGDASCMRLPAHVHCRNCPIYADTSRKLLDRMSVDLSAEVGGNSDLIDAASQRAARSYGQTAGHMQVLVFRLETEWLALPVAGLEEVATLRPIHSLPHRRGNALLGIVNIRGALLSCMSLKTVLNVDIPNPAASSPSARMLILTTREASVATVVDEIDGIYGLDPAQLTAVPSTLAHAAVKHTSGWGTCGKHKVGLLDIDAIRSAMQRGMQ